MSISSPSVLMAVFFAASFFLNGVLFPYFPVLLSERGLSGEQIAFVMSSPFIGRVLTMPVVGFAADRMSDRRPIVIVIAGSVAAALIAFTHTTSVEGAMILGSVLLIMNFITGPLADTVALTVVRRGLGVYGHMRAWGSVSFVSGNLIGGYVLEHYGSGPFNQLLVIGAVLAVMATAAIPRVSSLPMQASAESMKILWQPAFIAVLLAGGFIQASHAALTSFATLTWQGRGFDETVIGMFWAIGVLSEILLFALANRIPYRINPLTLMMIGGAIGVFRWMLFAVNTGTVITGLSQVLHAGSFAIAHLGIIRFLHDKVPEVKFATAQGLYIVMLSILMAGSGYLSGQLWNAIGDHNFMAMSAFSAMGILILVIVRTNVRRLPSIEAYRDDLTDQPQSLGLPG